MGQRGKRNKIKWPEFVEHSKVVGVDMDKAKFSSEARPEQGMGIVGFVWCCHQRQHGAAQRLGATDFRSAGPLLEQRRRRRKSKKTTALGEQS